MPLLDGYSGAVFGIANERSYAWHIAKTLLQHGATCAYGCLPGEKAEGRTREALAQLGERDPWVKPCDCSIGEQVDGFFSAYARDFQRLDFVIHAIAFADREWLAPGRFVETPREAYLQAIDVSAYSLVSMARAAREQMKAGGGGSIVAMSYLGSQRAVPGYNAMGVAKAALEATARYLALELGEDGIRVNTISGGPLKTLAASAIRGFKQMLAADAERSPLKRNVAGDDVGGAVTYLVSELGTGVTGENIFVDCGVNIVGV
jgi:enoyl-[acyl-carrier protein] reductase I